MPPKGIKPAIPGMCPEWESNKQPFGIWEDAGLTEPHWPEIEVMFLKNILLICKILNYDVN